MFTVALYLILCGPQCLKDLKDLKDLFTSFGPRAGVLRVHNNTVYIFIIQVLKIFRKKYNIDLHSNTYLNTSKDYKIKNFV